MHAKTVATSQEKPICNLKLSGSLYIFPIITSLLSPYSTRNCLRWLPNTNRIGTNKMKSTWPTQAPTRGDPTNHIPPARVGGHVGSVVICVGSFGVCVGSTRLLGYQHVGIGNANVSRWGYYPMRNPNTGGCAFWWNIALMLTTLLPLQAATEVLASLFRHYRESPIADSFVR